MGEAVKVTLIDGIRTMTDSWLNLAEHLKTESCEIHVCIVCGEDLIRGERFADHATIEDCPLLHSIATWKAWIEGALA